MERRSLLALPGLLFAQGPEKKFKLSLAQWSLHKAIQSRLITNLDFPRIAREQFGIEGLEYVNQLWQAPTSDYVRRLKASQVSTGTKCVLIMCDGEGFMGHPEKPVRLAAAVNHYKWVDITAELGGHSIRTNMYPGPKQPEGAAEVAAFVDRCAESFTDLCAYARKANLNVIIENHGGVSSQPEVVVSLMKKVNAPNFGTLPDFGNFPKEIDRYDAVKQLMPHAKGVSFKCFDFDAAGRETTIDMDKMMGIVEAAGYRGYVGIEYEGNRLTEFEGIQGAKRYLAQWTAHAN
ncbi:MAG: sugar phosphate isomerase/epimerase [Bryobacteraceae bacterium]|nr:sugar phosphate isomerase/epimerase [Bryobacteraceae bacterium]